MTRKMVKVCLKDLKREDFIKAVKNGSVYWEVEEVTEEQIRAQAYAELLTHIARIKKYAKAEWQEHNRIDKLWNEIFKDKLLRKKIIYLIGENKGQLKFAGLIALVGELSKLDIYWESKQPLYRAMQGAPVITNEFRGSTSYKLDIKELRRLENIIDNLRPD